MAMIWVNELPGQWGISFVREGTDFDMRVQEMMEAALEMLDAGGYPADIGAHLDLALCRLREHLGLPAILPNFDDDLGPGRLAI